MGFAIFFMIHWLTYVFGSAGSNIWISNRLWAVILLIIDVAAFIWMVQKAKGTGKIKTGIEKIAGGEVDYQIPVNGLLAEHKEIAEKEKSACGIDVGIKTKATIYNATEDKFESIENKTFLYKNGTFEQSDLDQELKNLNEILSRKWGYANKEFRDANKKSNYTMTPSKQYMAIDKKRKKLNRKIKRQREANNHLWSHYIIDNYETIGLETLSVKDFLEKKDVGENENRSHKENMELHNQKEFRRVASDTGLGQFL